MKVHVKGSDGTDTLSQREMTQTKLGWSFEAFEEVCIDIFEPLIWTMFFCDN